jgi:hypothetical protein
MDFMTVSTTALVHSAARGAAEKLIGGRISIILKP